MRTTMDKAGRVVIPRELRDRIGLHAGPVDLEIDGSGLHLSPAVAEEPLVERGGRLVIAPGGSPLSDDDVGALRDADQR